jgi:hypothetical protein
MNFLRSYRVGLGMVCEQDVASSRHSPDYDDTGLGFVDCRDGVVAQHARNLSPNQWKSGLSDPSQWLRSTSLSAGKNLVF